MRNSAEKWQAPNIATHYASERFATTRSRTRDQRLIERLLERHAPTPIERLLDAPCGTGRLAAALSQRCSHYVGADISPAMLAELQAARVVGDAAHLPMQTASIDVVVCCRLLHHLDAVEELKLVATELLRVSRGLIVASFWDSKSWPGLRRARGWRNDSTGRRAVPRATIEDAFQAAGGRIAGYAASCRFISMQTFVAIRKD